VGEATGTTGEKAASGDEDAPGQRETPGERANRELIELLNELRVALPGVQVLFAFLLAVPFTPRFGELDAGDRRVFYAAVLLAAAATLLLLAPSAHHRVRFRSNVKEHLLKAANVTTVVGMALLALAMSAVTYVITDLLYPGDLAKVVTAAMVSAFAVVWFVLPFLYRPERTPPADAPDEPDERDGR
jgi:MFS family permease